MTMQPSGPAGLRLDGTRPPSPGSVRRPMELAHALLNELTAALAAEGVQIRGAFAPYHHVTSPRDFVPAVEATGELLVVHFELPTTSNLGVPFGRDVLFLLVRELYREMRGASFFESAGMWQDKQGAFCGDLSIGVEVWTRDLARLEKFVLHAADVLSQDEIVLRITRADFRVLRPAKGDRREQ